MIFTFPALFSRALPRFRIFFFDFVGLRNQGEYPILFTLFHRREFRKIVFAKEIKNTKK